MKRGNLVFGMRFKMARWNFFFPSPPQIQRHGWITHVRRVSRIFFVWKDGWREGWKEFLIPRPENSAISRISNFLSVGSRVYRAGLHFNILKSYTVWTFSFFFLIKILDQGTLRIKYLNIRNKQDKVDLKNLNLYSFNFRKKKILEQ